MTTYYCDSSVLIKRYIPERGSAWVDALVVSTNGNQLFVAQITQAEIVSGLARLRREGVLTDYAVKLARRSVDHHAGREYRVIDLSTRIVQRAEDLLLAHLLRAYDAIQLASALDMADRLAAAGRAAPVFVSADRRLLTAAEAEGLITVDPNQHA